MRRSALLVVLALAMGACSGNAAAPTTTASPTTTATSSTTISTVLPPTNNHGLGLEGDRRADAEVFAASVSSYTQVVRSVDADVLEVIFDWAFSDQSGPSLLEAEQRLEDQAASLDALMSRLESELPDETLGPEKERLVLLVVAMTTNIRQMKALLPEVTVTSDNSFRPGTNLSLVRRRLEEATAAFPAAVAEVLAISAENASVVTTGVRVVLSMPEDCLWCPQLVSDLGDASEGLFTVETEDADEASSGSLAMFEGNNQVFGFTFDATVLKGWESGHPFDVDELVELACELANRECVDKGDVVRSDRVFDPDPIPFRWDDEPSTLGYLATSPPYDPSGSPGVGKGEVLVEAFFAVTVAEPVKKTRTVEMDSGDNMFAYRSVSWWIPINFGPHPATGDPIIVEFPGWGINTRRSVWIPIDPSGERIIVAGGVLQDFESQDVLRQDWMYALQLTVEDRFGYGAGNCVPMPPTYEVCTMLEELKVEQAAAILSATRGQSLDYPKFTYALPVFFIVTGHRFRE